MFHIATAFNQPIGNWNTANVTTTTLMFAYSESFNQAIGNWNTAKVTDMGDMFKSATAFNQPIGDWNTASVIGMAYMFENATAFNQPLGDWKLNTIVPLQSIFDNSGLDCGNYTKTLIGWSNNPLCPSGRNLGAIGMQYGTNAVAARNSLLTKGWIITGDAVFAPFNTLVPPATEEVADMNCDYFTSPLDHHKKLIDIDPNGNAFDYDNTTVTITNKFVSSIPSHVTTHTPGTTGYYQTASGTNYFRLGRRMHSIEAPGTYSINDGIKVRVYFNAEDTTYIRTDISPTSPINFSGWLKVELHDPQPIVNSMNTAAPELPIPTKIVFPIATGIENGSYYAEFLAEEFSTFVYYAATIIPLPVTLSEWSATCSEKEMNLKWTTQSELNNNYFIIEGSKDAQNWLEVYRTPGAGNSNSEIEYAYQLPATDNSYFRLGQVDYDGIKTYSNILHTDCGNSLNDIVIYPNPNFGTFKIKGFSDNASVTLYSISGKMLWESSNLKSDETINLDYLPKGIYNISIVSNNEIKNHKLIIAK
ncbi:MAG TPA: BspA family leucine-rich repeat surface protein [Chitinophagales bacterium]|nr:BspA family leucine-rich repeat surface protein [Chitinophagales bacterium]